MHCTIIIIIMIKIFRSNEIYKIAVLWYGCSERTNQPLDWCCLFIFLITFSLHFIFNTAQPSSDE